MWSAHHHVPLYFQEFAHIQRYPINIETLYCNVQALIIYFQNFSSQECRVWNWMNPNAIVFHIQVLVGICHIQVLTYLILHRCHLITQTKPPATHWPEMVADQVYLRINLVLFSQIYANAFYTLNSCEFHFQVVVVQVLI